MSEIQDVGGHTPLPWSADEHSGDIWSDENDPIKVCEVIIVRQAACYREASEEEREANAAFIVLACNAHYDLLSVVRDMFENPEFQVSIGGNPNRVEELMTRARGILERATGANQ